MKRRYRYRLGALMLLIAFLALPLDAYRRWRESRSIIYVQGDVNVPSRLKLVEGMTVIDALAAAGGPSRAAPVPKVRLVRIAGSGARGPQLLPVNLPAIVRAKDPTTNYRLMPGDRLMVYRDPQVPASNFPSALPRPNETTPPSR